MSFDMEPDGDPHGECAKEIHDLQTKLRDADLKLEALRKVALEHVPHRYEGDCPYKDDQDARDPDCHACKILGPVAVRRVDACAMCAREALVVVRMCPDCAEGQGHIQRAVAEKRFCRCPGTACYSDGKCHDCNLPTEDEGA